MMENLAQFPDEAIDLANQSGYPVILLSDRIAYADVIRAITEAIYLNFSTPLPKDGYAKQRLTHERFLRIYERLLTIDGVICQKTDNVPFFEFSMEQFRRCGFTLSGITYDLKEGDIPENIVTEHEKMFSERGIPICRLEARKGEKV